MSSAALFHRLAEKLFALNYPYGFDENVSESDLVELLKGGKPKAGSERVGQLWLYCRDVVVFLEDSVIRFLTESEREPIRSAASPNAFLQAFYKYADLLANSERGRKLAPVYQLSTAKKKLEQFKALLDAFSTGGTLGDSIAKVLTFHLNLVADVAVALYTADEGPGVVAAHHQEWQQDQSRRLVTTVVVLKDSVSAEGDAVPKATASSAAGDQSGKDEEEKVRKLLTPLYQKRGIPMPSSIPVAMQETVSFIKAARRCQSSPDALAEADALLDTVPLFSGEETSTSPSSAKAKGKPIDQVELEKACKVLRLLFMMDLRELQDAINTSIGELQNSTATCRVDTKLGRVGS
jgi:hypothetical protein